MKLQPFFSNLSVGYCLKHLHTDLLFYYLKTISKSTPNRSSTFCSNHQKLQKCCMLAIIYLNLKRNRKKYFNDLLKIKVLKIPNTYFTVFGVKLTNKLFKTVI